MIYFLTLALQAFCIYHIVKSKNEYYWIFLVLFLPGIGGLIYLLTQVFTDRDVKIVQSEIVKTLNPTKKIKDLQKKVDFSDTFQNRVLLADAWMELSQYKQAIEEYEIALNGKYNDQGVIKKIIECNYWVSNWEQLIFYAEKISDKSEFKSSRSEFLYGMALKELGELQNAEKHLRQIDQPYSNYEERYQLGQFLAGIDKKEDAKQILSEIINESNYMTKHNRTLYRNVVRDSKKLIETL